MAVGRPVREVGALPLDHELHCRRPSGGADRRKKQRAGKKNDLFYFHNQTMNLTDPHGLNFNLRSLIPLFIYFAMPRHIYSYSTLTCQGCQSLNNPQLVKFMSSICNVSFKGSVVQGSLVWKLKCHKLEKAGEPRVMTCKRIRGRGQSQGIFKMQIQNGHVQYHCT